MANRSYLYTVDSIPGYGPPPRIEDLAEWNWEVPPLHRVLLTGSPQLCHSMIWDSPMQAIAGDYDTGVANLERFLAALPQTDAVREESAKALAVLKNPERRRPHFLLEVGELVELVSTVDPDEDYDGWVRELMANVERELAEIGSVEGWIAYAKTLREDDTEKLQAATGAGYWPNVTYFSFTPPAEPEPAPVQPAQVQPAPVQPDSQPYVMPPNPQAQPYVMPQAPMPTGSTAWAVGLLALIPIPFLSALIAGLTMGLIGRGQRITGPLAAANGRNAANWGFTYLTLVVILGVAHFLLLFALTQDGPQSGFYPIGIPLTIFIVVSVFHLIVSVVGMTKAGRREVFTAPAIPFLRG